MTNGPRPPRRTPRRYPLTSYVPFALMVAVPLLLIVLAIVLISHAVAPSTPAAAPTSTPTPSVTATPITRTALLPTATATVSPVPAVTVALGSTAAGKPIGAATVFHGAHTTLWAFATVPHPRPGDTVRVAWRDLDRHSTIENWFQHITTAAASYAVHMYAYIGDTPKRPFPPGHYRVDVYRTDARHHTTLVASGAFTVTR